MSAVRDSPYLAKAACSLYMLTLILLKSEPDPFTTTTLQSRTLYQFQERVSQPVVAAFWAGGVAGAVSRTVVSPLERLKILMQVQSVGRDAYKMSVGQALGKMWKEEGWRGFMRGNGTNCIRIVPYSAIQFSSYNFYRRVRAMNSVLGVVFC
jgi:solute carrier family 25 (mitochondrial phosphate transporter), member 23/24/25/41